MKRRYVLIVGAILLVLLLCGSFFDLQISEYLYLKGNPFSLIFAIVGEYLTFGGLAFFGGIIIKTSYKFLKNKIWALLFTGGAIVYLVVGGVLFGHELSETDALGGVNAIFEKIYVYAPLGILLVTPMFLLGLKVSKNVDNLQKYVSVVGLSFAILLALVITMGIKEFACRPRYYYLIEIRQETILYRDWWVLFNQKDYFMQLDGVESNAFKSLPSGHACYSMCGLMTVAAFPILNPIYKPMTKSLNFAVIAFSFIVSLTRILCGRHYLSDVAIGMLIGLLCYFLINEIINNYINKKFEANK